MKKPVFTDVLQIGVVIRDLDAAMKRYWEEFGLGPWQINTFDSTNTRDMVIRGQRQNFAARAATTQIGNVEWELIEPLDDDSIYAEFLREHGEGLHHVGFAVKDFQQAMAFFRDKDTEVLLGGTWNDIEMAYWDTRDTLGCIAEIWTLPSEDEGFPLPDAFYPDPQHSDAP
jgi:methylmalonyl-CoA/ethylmalonyl-CoA epimerase